MSEQSNPIKYSDLVKPDDSIEKLIKQLDQLSDSYMNVYDNIKKNAIAVKASLEGVSGATDAGRKTIRQAADDTDKLTKALKERQFAESEVARQIAEVKAATHEANVIAKMEAKIANSAAGSYDALSAQYTLNKMILNQMSAEERASTKAGQDLEKETYDIYQQMKKLQEATGKTSLNVGNYEAATTGLRQQIMKLTEEMVKLRMEGKQDSEEYRELSQRAGNLRDAFADAQQEVNNMASDTSALDSVLGGVSAAGGGFAAVTGAMEMFGGASENVQEAQKKLQAVIAITNGLTMIQKNLQHQSALMLGLKKIQTLAAAKAEALATKNTIAATVAQKAFNLVAKANPYVLLATALITVVGALIAFTKGTGEAAKQQSKLNEAQKSWLDYLDYEVEKMTRVSNDRIRSLQNELDIARIRKASTEEIRKIEDGIFRERIIANARQKGFYATEIANLEENRKKVDELRKTLNKLNEAKAAGDKTIKIDVDLDGDIEKVKVDEAIDAVQGQIDNYGEMVEIAVGITTEGEQLSAEMRKMDAQRIEEDKDTQRKVTETLRKAQDERIKLIANSYNRQRAENKAATARAMADIQYTLDNEANLTVTQRKALNEQIVSLRRQLSLTLRDISNEQAAAELDATRQTEDMQMALMDDGEEKRRAMLAMEYDRQIEDIDTRLKTERGLTDKQLKELYSQRLLLQQLYQKASKELEEEFRNDQLSREAEALQIRIDLAMEGSQEQHDLRMQFIEKQREQELEANRRLAEDKRKDEKAINDKYDREALQEDYNFQLQQFDAQQTLDAAEFDLLRTSEAKKTRFRLEQEKARLLKILELNRTIGKQLSDIEIQTINATIARIDSEIQGTKQPRDIYDLFGLTLDDDQKSAISTSLQYATQALNEYLAARVEMAQKAVEASQKEVDAAQAALNAELEAKANGYAADVEGARKQLQLAKNTQQKALRQQEEAQKAQQLMSSIEQATNLVSASALIWSQLGFPWAIPAIATMWGSFAYSKIKAAQMTQPSEMYGEGTVELLQGGSHASGHDIDLGQREDGTRRRAEGGEFFAVINKRNSRRYRKEIPQVINSLNDGTFADKYLNTFNIGSVTGQTANEPADLGDLLDNVEAIKAQGEKRYITAADGSMILVYKNVRRRYLS